MTPNKYYPALQSDYKKTIHFDCQFPTYAEAFDHAKNAREILKNIIGLRDYSNIVIIIGN